MMTQMEAALILMEVAASNYNYRVEDQDMPLDLSINAPRLPPAPVKPPPARGPLFRKRKIDSIVPPSREDVATFGADVLVKWLNCEICNAMLPNMKTLLRHLLKRHGRFPFRCRICSDRADFETSAQLHAHLYQAHSKITFWPCSQCHKHCQTHYGLVNHWNMHHQVGLFDCAHCGFISPFAISIQRHASLVHELQLFVCPVENCEKTFKQLCKLKMHRLSHLGLKPFQCTWPRCIYVSDIRSNVIRHIRTVHFKLPFSVKEQIKRGIVDARNANDYLHTSYHQLEQI